MDRYEDFTPSLVSPAEDGATVVPSDGADLPQVTRALYVGQGGTLAVQLASGAQVALSGVPGGALLPLRARRVRATGTTASGIVALW